MGSIGRALRGIGLLSVTLTSTGVLAADNPTLAKLKASTRDIMAANSPCVVASRKIGLQALLADEGKATMDSVFALVKEANRVCDQAAKTIGAMRSPIPGPNGAAWQQAIAICAAGPRLASQSYAAMGRPGYSERQMTSDMAQAAQKQNDCSVEVSRVMVRVRD